MAQLASCPCLNVSFQLAAAPDTAFLVQDGPSEGYMATCLPNSIKVEYAALVQVRDLDQCRMKWLYCQNCKVEVYGVEDDDEQALPVLTPLDHRLAVTKHVLYGRDVELLKASPHYSSLYQLVIAPDRSFGANLPGAELTKDLQAILASLDATYSDFMARQHADMEARLAQIRAQEEAKLRALDAHAANERDCLFAAVYRAKHSGIDLNGHADGLPPLPIIRDPTGFVAGAARPGFLATSLMPGSNLPDRDQELSATWTDAPVIPTTTTATTRTSPPKPPRAAAKVPRTPTPPTTTTTDAPAPAPAIPFFDEADDDLFLLDEDASASPRRPTPSSLAAAVADIAVSDDDDEEEEDPPTNGATALALYASSVPVTIPPRWQPSPLAPPVPPVDTHGDDGGDDVDEDLDRLPPHEYIAKTYSARPGEFLVGSRPGGKPAASALKYI
ncbi:hypothetical protein GGF32_001167 [Allomyces javanicus]|nr:hypothetical protein GGF32_001167 [Allomyces javanicus]